MEVAPQQLQISKKRREMAENRRARYKEKLKKISSPCEIVTKDDEKVQIISAEHVAFLPFDEKQLDEKYLARKAHKKRQAQRQAERVQSEVDSVVGMCEINSQTHTKKIPLPQIQTVLNWDVIPSAIHPLFENDTPTERGARKRQQCESFLRVIEPLITNLQALIPNRRLKIADFGCGTGNSSLPLAYALPSCDFVLFDRYQKPVEIATQRAHEAKLGNLKLFLLFFLSLLLAFSLLPYRLALDYLLCHWCVCVCVLFCAYFINYNNMI
jgi:hypothetical protein